MTRTDIRRRDIRIHERTVEYRTMSTSSRGESPRENRYSRRGSGSLLVDPCVSRSSGTWKFRAPIGRLAPIWHSFPTVATHFANPKPALVHPCVSRDPAQDSPRHKFRFRSRALYFFFSLTPSGERIFAPDPNPRNPHQGNFYSAARSTAASS